MASKQFNTEQGYTIGIGTVTTVIDANGNVYANILTATSNITGPNVIANTGAFYGSGAGLTNITGGNVTGTVANATYATSAGAATTAGTVTTAAQPNITSVGNLTSLAVTGNVSANYFIGNGSLLTGLSSGSLANGNSSVTIPSANGNINLTAGGNVTLVVTSTGSNITGALVVSSNITAGSGTGGNITGANLVSANYFTGTLTTAAQPNITSVGNLATVGTITSGTWNSVIGTSATLSTQSNTGGGVFYIGGNAWSGSAPANTSTNAVTGIQYIGGTGSQLVTFASSPGGLSIQLDGSIFVGDVISYNPASINGATDGSLLASGTIAANGYVYSNTAVQTPLLTTGANTTAGTITGSWTLSAGSTIVNNTVSTATNTTITPTANSTTQYNITALASAATIATPSGTPVDGQKLMLRFKDNGTARALTWTTTSGGYRAVGVTLPTTTVISKVLYVGCIYNSQDVFWDVIAVAEQ